MGRALRVGLYSPFFGSTVGGGEKYLAVAAEAIRDAFPQHRVEIISPVPADRGRYESMLHVDLSGIELVSTRAEVRGWQRSLNSVPALRLYRNLAVSIQASRFTENYDVFISMVYVLPAFSRARTSVLLCQFPYPLRRTFHGRRRLLAPVYSAYRLPYTAARRAFLKGGIDAFKTIVCQSEYVRNWVAAMWQRDASVVNPPIDVPEQGPAWNRKEKIILSVGRFFAVGHSKRQDLMIEAFRRWQDAGDLTGWELHLAGSAHRDPQNAGYLQRIEELARGYQVRLHFDVPYAEVQDLYARASIYWHAAGYGVDAAAEPANLEHFGMTTAEAMGHGTVPVVIARGGQPEVVRDTVDGFLWNNLDQLRARTLELAGDAQLRRRMGEEARTASLRFSRTEFKRRMIEELAPVFEQA